MSIKIEVKTTEVQTKSGTSAKSGKPYSIREQEAWAYTTDREGKPHPYPQRIRLTLGDDQQPYPVGLHTLGPASFYVDRFSGLALGPVLVPLGVEKSVKAA